MKMADVETIINGKGFMVCFEWKIGSILATDHFPENTEPLIPTEEEAWKMAAKFAEKMRGKVVNVYVVKDDYTPVDNYREKLIENS